MNKTQPLIRAVERIMTQPPSWWLGKDREAFARESTARANAMSASKEGQSIRKTPQVIP